VPRGDEVRDLADTRLLIATPEALSGLLSADQTFFRRISLVICDEGHLLGAPSRGILQLYHSVSVGYFDARSLAFLSNRTNALLEWLRIPGDALFILEGTLPLLYLCWLGVRRMEPRSTLEEPREVLFTEIVESKRSDA
jgi:hypothetical protein